MGFHSTTAQGVHHALWLYLRETAQLHIFPYGKYITGPDGSRTVYDYRHARMLRDQGEPTPLWKQKSSWLSRCVRFVIAIHSPERVLESGLPMEAPEKNRCNSSEAAQGPIFSGPVSGGNTAKSRPFSYISRATEWGFSAVETAWRREVNSNSGTLSVTTLLFSCLRFPRWSWREGNKDRLWQFVVRIKIASQVRIPLLSASKSLLPEKQPGTHQFLRIWRPFPQIPDPRPVAEKPAFDLLGPTTSRIL